MEQPAIWLAAGMRTPFARVDGPLAGRDALGLAVPVVRAMAQQASGPVDLAIWGSVAVNLAYSNLAREIWLEAGLDPHVPALHDDPAVLHEHGRRVRGRRDARPAGPRPRARRRIREREPRPDRPLGQPLGLAAPAPPGPGRRRGGSRRSGRSGPKDVRLYVPEVKNRATGKSMGEHCEEMAKTWRIGRARAGRARAREPPPGDRGAGGRFPEDLVPVDGLDRDQFPRRDTSLEKLAALRPAFDRASGHDHGGQQLAADRRRRGRLGRDGGRASRAFRRRCRARGWSTTRSRRSTSSTKACSWRPSPRSPACSRATA